MFLLIFLILVVNLGYNTFSVSASSNCKFTYYISVFGNDRNTGLSSFSPWKSIAKVNSTKLKAGTCILFEGGKWFVGDLILSEYTVESSTGDPIQIGSYGNGKAGIYSQNGSGILIYNQGNISIKNLYIYGGGDTTNKSSGIIIFSDKADSNGIAQSNVKISNVDIGYFGKSGISIGALGNSVGFDNVHITDSNIHDNGLQGISTYASMNDIISNVKISNVDVSYNRGSYNLEYNNGDGIILGNARDSSVTNSRVFENGSRCKATSCGSGIMVYNSKNILIEKNKVYNNHTSSGADGNGIDIDLGTRDSIIQFNESYNNDGPGILLFNNSQDQKFSGNIVRYNIVKDNGAKNSNPDIAIGGYISNLEVYNNTIRTINFGNNSPLMIWDWKGSNISIVNNILYKQGVNGYNIVYINSLGTNLFLKNNNYYSSDGNFRTPWNGSYFTNFTDWQNVVQDTYGNIKNPEIDSTTLRTQLESPMADAGVVYPIKLFDFWGNGVYPNGNTDIGATEVQ